MDYTWTARARWVGPLDTTVYARTHTFTVGAPASFKPSDPHPSAVEYLLAALSGDLLNGFGVEAARAGVLVEALELTLAGRLGNPLVYLGVIGETGDPGVRAITGTLYVSADADPAVLDTIWRATLARAPVYNTLKPAVDLALDLRIVP